MQTQDTWVSGFTLLSRGAFYSSPIILVLSLIIVVVALFRGAKAVAGLFAILSIVMMSFLITINMCSMDARLTLFMISRHIGQLLGIFPYALILGMLIKTKNKKANHH